MGYNTTVVIPNDALDLIANDPEFGRHLAMAIRHGQGAGFPIEVPAGGHYNAAVIVETHHHSEDVDVTVGHNTGRAKPAFGPHDYEIESENERTYFIRWPDGVSARVFGTGSDAMKVAVGRSRLRLIEKIASNIVNVAHGMEGRFKKECDDYRRLKNEAIQALLGMRQFFEHDEG